MIVAMIVTALIMVAFWEARVENCYNGSIAIVAGLALIVEIIIWVVQ